MLEDDYDVDWEVDPNEHSHAPHPHRVALGGRPRARERRPGAPIAHPPQLCLSPVGRAPAPTRLAPAGGQGGAAVRARAARPCTAAHPAERFGG
jgi:hypothetical protein